MLSRTHGVNYEKMNKELNISNDVVKFDYIVSRVKFKELRKFIYFYSPLSFKNKSQHMIIVSLSRRDLSNFFIFLDSKKLMGIPYEYLDGEIEFQYEDNTPIVFAVKKFLTNNTIQEELRFKNICFSLSHKKQNNKFKVISISNSYCVRNCLPFDIQIVLAKNNDVHYIPKGGKVMTDSLSFFENLEISLFFLNFRSQKIITLYSTTKELKSTSFTVIDDRNNQLTLFANVLDGETKTIVIYSTGVIINNTLLDVKFNYYKNKKKHEVAGQKDIANMFLVSDEKHLVLDSNGYISQPINISALGIRSVVECKKREKSIEFVMECNLSLVAQDLDIYCNLVTFAPRFILYNQLHYTLLVCLTEDANETDLIRPQEKKAFYFFGRKPDSKVCLRIMESGNMEYPSGSKWNWSCPISLLSDGLLTFQINGFNIKEKKYINLEKKIEASSTFVIIGEANYDNSQFIIENFSSNISLKIWQQSYENSADYIDVNSQSIFAWDNYYSKKILCVQFYIGALNSRPFAADDSTRKYEIENNKVILSHTNETKVYPATEVVYLKTSMYSGFMAKVLIHTDGMRMSFKLSDITHDVSRISGYLTKMVEISIKIEKLGISLIGDNKNLESRKQGYRRHEIIYITLKDILFYAKKQSINQVINSEMQVKINDIEIDNEYSYITHFPIILRPVNSSKFRKKDDERGELPPFFNCALFLQKLKKEETTKIILLNYLIQSFNLSIDTNVIEALLHFFHNLTIEMKTSVTQINPVFIDNKINMENGIFIKENYFDPIWLQKKIEREKSKFFIQTLETSPIEIIVSFITQSKNKIFQRYLASSPVLSSLISALSNIENAPIRLNGSKMNNLYGNIFHILDNILSVYKQSTLLQVMKIFGAIDILGNPLNLLHTLGTGVSDFFQKPIKGIVKGPLETAKGMLDGSLSLVKHTVEGTFSTTSKITSGLSKGILYLTQDDEYINEREKKKITEKPKNFVEGIGYGISSMAGGIFYGVTDVVMKPIQGAKKDKWVGFGKGIMKGLAGVVVKPISGVLEMVSKTTEGIKNTVNTDDKYKLERLPRPFYGKFKFIKSYNAYHSQVIELMHNRIEQFRNHSVDFYSSELYKNDKGDNVLMVFSTTSLYIIDVTRRELKTVLHYSEIKDIYLESNDKIRLILNREFNGKSSTSISFSKHNSNAKQILRKMKEAKENNYDDNINNY